MSWFFNPSTPTQRYDETVVVPLPPRKTYDTSYDEQAQSPFFTKLPAEIRNKIYDYAFQSGARELLSVEAHPLSLLLTCRKVNYEASTIAFRQHTFPLSTNLGLENSISMRNVKSHLSSQQVQSITALSYDLRRNYGCKHSGYDMARVLANAILVFPNLKRFELRLLRGRKASEDIHCMYNLHTYDNIRKDVMRKHNVNKDIARRYLPHWFIVPIFKGIMGDLAYPWQMDERWSVELPQLEDDTYFEVSGDGETMTPDAVGNVRGVRMCPCNCGSIEWTSADIVQETGRRIEVDTVYYGPEDRVCPDAALEASVKARLAPKTIILQEGAHPLDLAPGFRHAGKATQIGYEADEEYWERLRRKNGHWKTLFKLTWQLLTSQNPEERFPGSWALKEGDWAVMAEAAVPK